MFVGNQRTITHAISCSGTSLYSGLKSKMTFKPAEENTGVVFVRKDVKGKNNKILAHYKNINTKKNHGTTIVNKDKVEVSAIEHVMSAIWGSKIDNIIVELNSPEPPVVDGSTEPFLFLLKSAGFKQQEAKRKILKIKKEIVVEGKGCKILIKPSESFIVQANIEFQNKCDLNDTFVFNVSTQPYKDIISRARTFFFENNTETAERRGAKNDGIFSNAIILSNEGKILNKTGFRYKSELAKHKILDLIGDVFLAGYYILGEIDSVCSDHALHHKLLKSIFSRKGNYEIV